MARSRARRVKSLPPRKSDAVGHRRRGVGVGRLLVLPERSRRWPASMPWAHGHGPDAGAADDHAVAHRRAADEAAGREVGPVLLEAGLGGLDLPDLLARLPVDHVVVAVLVAQADHVRPSTVNRLGEPAKSRSSLLGSWGWYGPDRLAGLQVHGEDRLRVVAPAVGRGRAVARWPRRRGPAPRRPTATTTRRRSPSPRPTRRPATSGSKSQSRSPESASKARQAGPVARRVVDVVAHEHRRRRPRPATTRSRSARRSLPGSPSSWRQRSSPSAASRA